MQKSIVAITVILYIFFLSVSHSFSENGAGREDSKLNSSVCFSGIVKDTDTGEKLVCAKIEIAELNKKVFTDMSGKFKITGLAPGEFTLKISYIAYEDKEIIVTSVKAPQDEIIIRLKQL
jgi:uncharacterized membrane protein